MHSFFPRASRSLLPAIILVFLATSSCKNANQEPQTDEEVQVLRLSGKTMGTTYSVIAVLDQTRIVSGLHQGIDSLLLAVNADVNTYDPGSLISRFNQGEAIELPIVKEEQIDQLQSKPGSHFAVNLLQSLPAVQNTNAAFDPTVGPLVEYFGFGASDLDTTAIDAAKVAELQQLVGMNKVVMDTLASSGTFSIKPALPGVRLDLSAIAKGYGVDQVIYFLMERYGCTRAFVEIGGETRAIGLSPRNEPWTIGINTPDPGASLTDMKLIIQITDRAIATSGNYRNVRVRGGKQYVHTIDPKTGYPRASTLLSATILAPDCATADAYATACMASGEDAMQVLAKARLPACLIFADSNSIDRQRVVFVGDFQQYVLTQ